MLNLKVSKIKLLFWIIFVAVLVFSRLYNLENTARFIWDESSDLVRMHQIFVEKNITLIGPISEDGHEVFSSLTYYMLLPFAVISNFDPIGPVIGSAFWGILTVITLVLIVKKLNPKLIYLAAPVAIFWYPLVETGRWAWNPNLIPFWISLSLLLYFQEKKIYHFFSGIFLGLTFHHHYLSIFTISAFWLTTLVNCLKTNRLKKIIVFSSGLTLSFIPFILFDLMHPPGLFLSRILYFNFLDTSANLVSLFSGFLKIFDSMLFYYTQSSIGKIIMYLLITFLLVRDIRERSRSLQFSIIWISQIIGISLFSVFANHYLLPSTIFFLIWILYPRKNHLLLQKIILITLVILSLSSIKNQLTAKNWQTDIVSVKKIVNVIENKITKDNLKNNNIVVLASPDNNVYGRRYRDLMLIHDIKLKSKEEYQYSDHLFVITISSEEAIRNDPAYEIQNFKYGKIVENWNISESDWRVFLFTRNP